MFLVYLEMYKDEKRERSAWGEGKEGGWFKFLCKYGMLFSGSEMLMMIGIMSAGTNGTWTRGEIREINCYWRNPESSLTIPASSLWINCQSPEINFTIVPGQISRVERTIQKSLCSPQHNELYQHANYIHTKSPESWLNRSEKTFFLEFLFLSSGFKVSHCFVGDYRIVSSTFSNMINYVQSKVLKVFQNFRYFSHHHLWTNLHPFKCVFCVILFCFTLLCVPYVLCIPLNCFYFSVSFQFLIVPCVYLWILKVSFFSVFFISVSVLCCDIFLRSAMWRVN